MECLGSPRPLHAACTSFLRQRRLESQGQLIRAGRVFCATGVALEKPYGACGIFAFQKFADGLQVAGATVDEGQIVDFSVVQRKADVLGTHALGDVRIGLHGFLLLQGCQTCHNNSKP